MSGEDDNKDGDVGGSSWRGFVTPIAKAADVTQRSVPWQANIGKNEASKTNVR